MKIKMVSMTDSARKVSEKVVGAVNSTLDSVSSFFKERKLRNKKQVLLLAKRAARARCDSVWSCFRKLTSLTKALILDAVCLGGEYFYQLKPVFMEALASIMAIIVATIEKYERILVAVFSLANFAKVATAK